MVVRAGGADLEAPPAGWVGVLNYSDATHGANIRKAEFNHLLDGLVGLSYSWNAYANASRGECAQLLYNLLLIKGGGTGSTTSTTHIPGSTTTAIAPTTTTTLPSGGPTVYITATGTKYHRDGCRYLEESKIAISLSEAKAQGYTPCKVCNPPI